MKHDDLNPDTPLPTDLGACDEAELQHDLPEADAPAPAAAKVTVHFDARGPGDVLVNHSTIVSEPVSKDFRAGSHVWVMAMPDAGCRLNKWTIDGKDAGRRREMRVKVREGREIIGHYGPG